MDKYVQLSFDEVIQRFVKPDLIDKVGDLLNNAQVSNGEVHHSLAVIIADDTVHNSDTLEEALAAYASLSNFMYQYITNAMAEKLKKEKGRGLQ